MGFKRCFVGKRPAYNDGYHMRVGGRGRCPRNMTFIPATLCTEVLFIKTKKAGEIAGLGGKISRLGLNITCEKFL